METNLGGFGMRPGDTFMSFTGVIIQMDVVAGSMGRFDGCSQMVTVEGMNGDTVNFFMNSSTFIVDYVTLYESLPITVFYNGNAPTPLIYPPQFTAAVIAPEVEGRNVYVGYFNNVLLSRDQSLRLNISPSTEIVTANNQTFKANPGNHTLVVLYSMVTRSIPPQTTPEKIIVLCGR